MIMILQERPSFGGQVGASLGKGLSKSLESFLQGMGEQRKSEKLKGALKSLETTFSPDFELTPEEKLLNVQYALRDFPDVAANFSSKIAPLGLQEKKSFFDRLNEDHKQADMQRSLDQAQQYYDDPDLPVDKKAYAIYSTLSKYPQLAKNIIGSMQDTQEGEQGDLFSQGYNAILKGDTKAFQEILNNPKTPLKIKKDLAGASSQFSQRKSVEQRELRNRQTLVSKSYNDAINQEIKLSEIGTAAEQAASRKNIKRLEILRQKDMKRLLKNPDSYHKLYLWEHLNDDFLPEEGEGEEAPESVFDNLPMPTEEQMGMTPSREPILESPMMEELSSPQGKVGKRVRFDPSNPIHAERANELLQLSGGDPDKFNELMSEEFE